MASARVGGFPPGAAAKFYGVMNFLELGMFGRIGRGGLLPIKNRQYEEGWEVTPGIDKAFSMVRGVLAAQPRREFQLFKGTCRRVLMASDASYEGGVGKAGFLMVVDPGLPGEERVAMEVIIPLGFYARWGPMATYISQLELLVVLVAVLACAARIRGTRGMLFVDNTPALMALVKGSSGVESLDDIARQFHLANFALGAAHYYEYVQSASNWAVEISRVGPSGRWAAERGFTVGRC